jgi:hypothetical protein
LPFALNSCPIAAESVDKITLKSPPACLRARREWAKANAESGVSAAGFETIAHPATSAGATLRASIAFGKPHGVIAPTTPTGCLTTIMRLSGECPGIVSP